MDVKDGPDVARRLADSATDALGRGAVAPMVWKPRCHVWNY